MANCRACQCARSTATSDGRVNGFRRFRLTSLLLRGNRACDPCGLDRLSAADFLMMKFFRWLRDLYSLLFRPDVKACDKERSGNWG